MNKLLQFSTRRVTPVILQTEAAECGLACLAMVASYHGHRIDLASLRRQHSVSLKGATLNQLMHIAGHLRLAPRPLKVELDSLEKLTLPAILHWDFNHFVVLTRVRGNDVTVHDPGHGGKQLTLSEVSKHFTGVALELAPAQGFTPKVERQRMRFTALVGHMVGAKRTLLQVFLLAGALEVFAIVSPLFMQLVTDHAIVSEDRDLLTVLGAGFLLLVLVQVGVTAVRSWVVMVLGTTLNLQLLSNLFCHLLKLPMSYFEKRHLGDVASRFESLNVIQRTLTTSFIEAIVDGLMALITLLMMLIYSVKLTLVVCLAAGLYGAVRLALYRPLRQAQEEQIGHGARQQSNFLETVRGMQSVKLFNGHTQRKTAYQNLVVDNFNAGIRVQRLSIVFHSLNGALFGIENIFVVWLGGLLVLDGGFSIGMLFAFLVYKQQFTSRMSSFIEKGIEFKMLGLHTERVADIALTAPEPDDAIAFAPVAGLCADIEIKNVSFRYSDAEPWVLNEVNMSIKQGESVAIVGPSGCGKTTLLKIVLGLLPATEGEVLVGGKPIAQLGSRYRALIGTVMQEDQLFAGSLADNIGFFDAEPDQARIEACAQSASVHDDILAMPMAYNTLIGDMGTTLSGGQKQRVLLARALYKQPKILALDEATSHLDVIRERLVNEAIRQLKLTRLIIAHRPETIASADRVIILGQQNAHPGAELISAVA
jgi:ATP-binding cassette, subfamily B, bacterial CvaB/MchF/RaxB